MLRCLPLLLIVGCAPTLSTMTPARIVPEGHLQVSTAVDATETTGPVREAIDAVEDMSRRTLTTPAGRRRAAEAATAAFSQPPSLGMQIALAYGVAPRLELSLRTSVIGLRVGARWQFLKASPGWYGVLGIGGSGQLYGIPLQQFTSAVEVNGFSRWDLDIPLHFGFSNRYVHVWGGPKVVVSTLSADFRLCMNNGCRSFADGSASGTVTYFGGQFGIAAGYRKVWFGAEITVTRVSASAEVDIDVSGREETCELNPDGWAIAPSVGMWFWF